MPNIKLNYIYRDYANYKNHGEAIFSNPNNFSLKKVEKLLRAKLIDESWFYASQWGLNDLHFENYDDENDHAYHEFIGAEFTDELATESESIKELMQRVSKTTGHWLI